jgi:glycine/D-amino acid oxidase-like deaminating enzyme
LTARHFDAIVIGAGITGAAVASFLSETGLKVLILERYKPVFGASGGNLGQISISDRTESWHMPLAVESQDYYHNLQSKSYDIEYVRSGGSVVLKGDEQLGLAAKAKEKMKGFGVAAELVKNRADILRIEPHIDPDTFDALLYCPLEGKLNPLLTTLAFLDMAKKNGARLLTDSPVIGFTLKQNKIAEVITPQDTFTAGHIVNCAGPRAAFVADLASVKLPIRFHKGTALVSEPVEPTITGPLVGGGFSSIRRP